MMRSAVVQTTNCSKRSGSSFLDPFVKRLKYVSDRFCSIMAGGVGPPLPVELVCPLCKDLVDEAVSVDSIGNFVDAACHLT